MFKVYNQYGDLLHILQDRIELHKFLDTLQTKKNKNILNIRQGKWVHKSPHSKEKYLVLDTDNLLGDLEDYDIWTELWQRKLEMINNKAKKNS